MAGSRTSCQLVLRRAPG